MLKIIRRVFSFGDWSQHHPSEPPPGNWLDAQFDEIIDRIDAWDGQVRKAITHEGRIGPGIVGLSALDDDFRAFLDKTLADSVKNLAFQLSEHAKGAVLAEKRAVEARITTEMVAARAKLAEEAVEHAEIRALAKIRDLEAEIARIEARNAEITPLVGDLTAGAGSAEAWAESSRLWAEHMPDTLPDNALKVTDISGDHWSSRWWANQASNAFGMLTSLYLGVHSEPPLTNNNGGPIAIGSIYYDSDDGQPYVWNGSAWVPFYQPGVAATMTLWYVATAGQTAFPFGVADKNGVTWNLDDDDPETILASVNGVRLMTPDDWTVSVPSSTVTFARPLRAGDVASFDLLVPPEKLGPGRVEAWRLKPLTGLNGVALSFPLETAEVPGVTVLVNRSEELVVSLDGVLQAPGVSYTAAGSTITFATAPTSDSYVFITWFRSTGGTGVVTPPTDVDWDDITDKPATYPPTLPIAQSGVTGLTTDLAGKEPAIAIGTTAQYWRGDKTWQTLPAGGGGGGAVTHIGDDPPASPTVGQTWWESDTGNSYIYYDDGAGSPQWVPSNVGAGAGPVDWVNVTGKPSTFPPTVPIAQSSITNLTTDLAGKVNDTGDTMTGPLRLPAGTVALPSLAVGEANSGLYANGLSGTGYVMGVAHNGALVMRFVDGANISDKQFRMTGGNASLPGFSFSAETNSGFYYAAANNIRQVMQGTITLQFTSSLITTFVPITLPGAPTIDLHAATKKYVDDSLVPKAPLASPAFTGSVVSNPGIFASVPSGTISLRPNGPSDATGELSISTLGHTSVAGNLAAVGNLHSEGAVYSNGSGYFIGKTTAAVLGTAAGGSGAIYLRPVAYNSTTNETKIDSAGTLTVNGNIIAGSGDIYTPAAIALRLRPGNSGAGQLVISVAGDVTAVGSFISTAGYFYSATNVVLRPNNSSTGQMVVGTTGNVTITGGLGINGASAYARQGLAAPTGTIQRTTYVTSSVTLPQLAGVVMAMITDLRAMGVFS